MDFSERCCEGFALAATIARDGDGSRAQAGLAAVARTALLPLCTTLAAASKAERRERIRRITSSMRQSPRPGGAWPIQRWRTGWTPEVALQLLVLTPSGSRGEG